MRASYGSSQLHRRRSPSWRRPRCASVIGKLELDKTFEERDNINCPGGRGARRGGAELGREGAALRDQGPDAAEGDPARDAGADHRRAREARADRRLRRPRQEQINIATGEREAFIARSEGEKQAEINKAQGEAAAIIAVADATADAIDARSPRRSASPAASRPCSSRWPSRRSRPSRSSRRSNNTLIVPSNMSEVSGLIATRDGAEPQQRRSPRLTALCRRAARRLPREGRPADLDSQALASPTGVSARDRLSPQGSLPKLEISWPTPAFALSGPLAASTN